MAKLVDALALGASPERGGGSSPPSCTNLRSYKLRLARPELRYLKLRSCGERKRRLSLVALAKWDRILNRIPSLLQATVGTGWAVPRS